MAVKKTVRKGLSHEILLTRMLRRSGLHMVQVVNGLAIKQGHLEQSPDWEDGGSKEWANGYYVVQMHNGKPLRRAELAPVEDWIITAAEEWATKAAEEIEPKIKKKK